MKSLATAPPNPVPPPEVPNPAPDPPPPPEPGVPDPVPLPTPIEPGLPTYEDVPPVKPIDGRGEWRGSGFEAVPHAA